MTAIDELRLFVATLSPDAVVEKDDVGRVESLLASCWDALDEASEAGMSGEKLYGRTKHMRWEPPILEFTIERHGAMVGGGSGRAELQHWTVDVERGVAIAAVGGYRQIRKAEARWDARAVAQRVATSIREGRKAPCLAWRADNEVRVVVSEIVHGANQQTRSGRARRFRKELGAQLAEAGWRQKKAGTWLVYERMNA